MVQYSIVKPNPKPQIEVSSLSIAKSPEAEFVELQSQLEDLRLGISNHPGIYQYVFGGITFCRKESTSFDYPYFPPSEAIERLTKPRDDRGISHVAEAVRVMKWSVANLPLARWADSHLIKSLEIRNPRRPYVVRGNINMGSQLFELAGNVNIYNYSSNNDSPVALSVEADPHAVNTGNYLQTLVELKEMYPDMIFASVDLGHVSKTHFLNPGSSVSAIDAVSQHIKALSHLEIPIAAVELNPLATDASFYTHNALTEQSMEALLACIMEIGPLLKASQSQMAVRVKGARQSETLEQSLIIETMPGQWRQLVYDHQDRFKQLVSGFYQDAV